MRVPPVIACAAFDGRSRTRHGSGGPWRKQRGRTRSGRHSAERLPRLTRCRRTSARAVRGDAGSRPHAGNDARCRARQRRRQRGISAKLGARRRSRGHGVNDDTEHDHAERGTGCEHQRTTTAGGSRHVSGAFTEVRRRQRRDERRARRERRAPRVRCTGLHRYGRTRRSGRVHQRRSVRRLQRSGRRTCRSDRLARGWTRERWARRLRGRARRIHRVGIEGSRHLSERLGA